MAAKDAEATARPKARRSRTLVVWAFLFLLAGGVLAGYGVYAWTTAEPTPPWAVVALAAGGGALVTALVFLVLGLFVVDLGPKTMLDEDQKLIVRAATAMVLIDRTATHVEIEALRVWVQRNFGLAVGHDELYAQAKANAKNRDPILTTVADHHRSHPTWGADDDQMLIGACTSVIVADLRNRDEELDYLRKLAEAVEYDAAKRDTLIADLKALELALEELVVAKIMAHTGRGGR